MPLKLINAGSSLLSASLLAALWAVRCIRIARQHQRSTAPKNGSVQPEVGQGKYFAELTAEAISLLVRLQAVPYYILDVRSAEAVDATPLPTWLTGIIQVPEHVVTSALAPPHTAWGSCAADSDTPPPTQQHLLVIASESQQQDVQLAQRVAAVGYDRIAVLKGGLTALPHSLPDAAAASLLSLHRDALALVLGMAHVPQEALAVLSSTTSSSNGWLQQQADSHPGSADHEGSSAEAHSSSGQDTSSGSGSGSSHRAWRKLSLCDVRRHDERILYGTVPGALHVPADELASALQLPPDQFKRRYHFDQPAGNDVLIMQSRGSSRAVWAAQLALDAGWKRVLVSLDGTYGWRLSPAIQAYPAYQQCEAPPDPEPFSTTLPDVVAGLAELQQLGLLDLLTHQQQQRHQ